jgi:hypothetical protein
MCVSQFYDSSHRKLQRRKPLSYYQISTGVAVTIQSAAVFLAQQRSSAAFLQRVMNSVDRVRARKRSRPTALSEARLRVSMMPQLVRRALVEMRAQAGGDEMERLLAATPSDESGDSD